MMMQVLVCFSGAFKTLDKDNNGTINLDIKEVLVWFTLMFFACQVETRDQNNSRTEISSPI